MQTEDERRYLDFPENGSRIVWDRVIQGWIMSQKSKEFLEKMQEFFPSTREEYNESIKEYGEILETVVIEDIFMPRIIMLLAENEKSELLKNVFRYFEEIVNGNDLDLVSVFSVTVLECLGNDKRILETAKQYMGPKTMLLQIEADRALGRN